MKKVVFINTLGEFGSSAVFYGVSSRVLNCSMVSFNSPIIRAALEVGWDGKQDARGKQFLKDLKKAFDNYNNFSIRQLLLECEKFKGSVDNILFVCIDDEEDIERIKKFIDLPSTSLLITDGNGEVPTGYDWYFSFSDSFIDSENRICELISKIYWG